MNKLSSNNPTNVCVAAEEQTGGQRRKYRIRRLQGKEECDEAGVLGMDSNIMRDLMKNQSSSNVGFQSQFNKNKNLKSSNAAIKKIAINFKSGEKLSILSEDLEQDINLPDKYTTDALNYRRQQQDFPGMENPKNFHQL